MVVRAWGSLPEPREKNEIEAVSSVVIAAATGKKQIDFLVTSQLKKKAHAAKLGASKKTRLIVHPNVRFACKA